MMNCSNPVGSLLARSAKLSLVRVESADLDIVRADLIDRVGLRELHNKLHVGRKLGEKKHAMKELGDGDVELFKLTNMVFHLVDGLDKVTLGRNTDVEKLEKDVIDPRGADNSVVALKHLLHVKRAGLSLDLLLERHRAAEKNVTTDFRVLRLPLSGRLEDLNVVIIETTV